MPYGDEPTVQITGNLTADPELRYTASGTGVANFTVAHTPRVKQGDEWVDGEAVFLRVSAWRELGEHVAESLSKGDRATVRGILRTARWKDNDGTQRERLEATATDVAASMTWANVSIKKTRRDPAPAAVDPASGESAELTTPPQ